MTWHRCEMSSSHTAPPCAFTSTCQYASTLHMHEAMSHPGATGPPCRTCASGCRQTSACMLQASAATRAPASQKSSARQTHPATNHNPPNGTAPQRMPCGHLCATTATPTRRRKQTPEVPLPQTGAQHRRRSLAGAQRWSGVTAAATAVVRVCGCAAACTAHAARARPCGTSCAGCSRGTAAQFPPRCCGRFCRR